MDEHITELVECEGSMNPVCISFNHLSLSLAGQEVEINISKGTALIKTAQGETQVSTLDATEFPNAPKSESQNHGVACRDLAEFVKQVSWSALTDESRYMLKSVLIESEAKKLTVVSTNGRELAFIESALIGSKFSAVVPSQFTVNFCSALLRDGAILNSSQNTVGVTHDSGSYSCKQLEGNYPNWRGVVPKGLKPLGEFCVPEMRDMFSGCVGFDNNTEAKGDFKFSKTGLTIEFKGESGSKLTRFIAGDFATFTVVLSLRKMLLIFKNIKSEKAKISHVDELTPISITSDDLTILTVPMRL